MYRAQGILLLLAALFVACTSEPRATEPQTGQPTAPTQPTEDLSEDSSDDGSSAAEAETPTTMKARLSKRLSPRAKKLVLLEDERARIRALVQVAPSTSPETFRAALEEQGAEVSSWNEETRLLAVELEVGQLNELADHEGVVYIDTATDYRR